MVAAVPVPAAVRTTLAGIVAEVLDSGCGAAATCTAGRGSPATAGCAAAGAGAAKIGRAHV